MVEAESSALKNSKSRNVQPQLGAYVTGRLQGLKESRQGVLTEIKPNGTSVVKGELDTYICEGSLIEVLDWSLDDKDREFVSGIRRELAMKNAERLWNLKPGTGEAFFDLMRQMDIDDSSEDEDPDM